MDNLRATTPTLPKSEDILKHNINNSNSEEIISSFCGREVEKPTTEVLKRSKSETDISNIDNPTSFLDRKVSSTNTVLNRSQSETDISNINHVADWRDWQDWKVMRSDELELQHEKNQVAIKAITDSIENKTGENKVNRIKIVNSQKNNNRLFWSSIFITLASIVLATTFSLLFLIGIAISILLLILSVSKDYSTQNNCMKIGEQNMLLQMLSEGISLSNVIGKNDVALNKDVLLAAVDEVVSNYNANLQNKHYTLVSNLHEYKIADQAKLEYQHTSEGAKKGSEITKAVKERCNMLLENTNLTDELERVGCNISNFKEDIISYINSLPIDDIQLAYGIV